MPIEAPKIVGLTSQSKVKIEPTRSAYQKFYHAPLDDKENKLVTFDVKSDIAEQPWSRWVIFPYPHFYNETKQGADNRLKHAKEQANRENTAIDRWVSMESGGIFKKRIDPITRLRTHDFRNHYEDRTVVIVEKSDGRRSVVISRTPIEFPQEAWDRAKKFGFKKHTVGSQIEAISRERGYNPTINKQDWYQSVENGQILKKKDESKPTRANILEDTIVQALRELEKQKPKKSRRR